jgi:hypothetical protein
MSGGKGGSTTSSVTIPEYIEAAAQRNLNKAERISQIGYTPYYGPDVAAFTPMQQAGFQNIANTAGAFGMAAPTTQQDIMGGMGPATTYAGGVQGYSSAPIYEQSLATLGQQRPGQKAYIDSFFIDPYAGGAAAGNFAPIDYTSYGTMADQAAANRANDLAIAQAGAGDYTSTDFAGNEVPYTVVDATDTRPAGYVSNPPGPFTEQRQYTGSSPMTDGGPAIMYNSDGTTTDLGYTLGPSVAGGRGTIVPGQPSGGEQASAYITNPAEGITDTSTAGTGTQILNDVTEFGTGLASNTLAGNILLGPSYNVGGANNPIETPTVAEMQASAPPGMTYQPSTGSYVAAPAPASAPAPAPVQNNDNDSGNTAHEDMMKAAALKAATKTATASAPVSTPRPISRDDAAGGADTGDSGGTVLCTAYASMGYLPADIWSLDTRYGIKRFRKDPVMVSGYRLWASPIAEFIKTDTLAAKAVRAALWPMVRVWAEEMAHQMKPEKYSGNKFGKLVMAMGEPFSYAVGATLLKRNAQKEL